MIVVHICNFLRNISFQVHLIISIILRVALILYGQVHDKHSELPYTDVDYKVVTDGARNILLGQSPYNRHTYRYSPILAYIQIPNILMHETFGKFVYATFDILVAALIYTIVQNELRNQCRKAFELLCRRYGKRRSARISDGYKRCKEIAKLSSVFWLHNPLTVVISTRGSGDSFSCFFVILTIYFLAKSERPKQSNWNVFLAGISHGIAIHLRLYPLLFSLAYFLCLSDRFTRTSLDFIRQIVFPSGKQCLLICGTLISLLSVTVFFHFIYGRQYLYQAYYYHFVRKDVRHNFSLYFLMQYLSGNTITSLVEKLFVVFPKLLLLVYLSFRFGQFRQTLPFCIFAQAFVMVTYNTVVTSQYFIWYLSLLPLCIKNMLSISLQKAVLYFTIWVTGQGMWLLPAYLLEFKTSNTFFWIGAQGVLFFLVNIFILCRFIENYSFTSFKFKKLF